MKTKSAFTLIELLIILAIVAILASLVMGGCSRSSGTRIGVITKFSNKGIFRKSNEGELLIGGMRSVASSEGSVSVANVWAFTVFKPDVVAQVKAALNTGQPVALDYDQVLFRFPWVADTSYTITGVRPVVPAAQAAAPVTTVEEQQ